MNLVKCLKKMFLTKKKIVLEYLLNRNSQCLGMSKPLYKTIFKFSHNWTDTIFSSVPYVNGYKRERKRERDFYTSHYIKKDVKGTTCGSSIDEKNILA